MTTLFPLDPLYPVGFDYVEDFITPAEENSLLSFLETVPLHAFLFQGYEAKRRVASFGYDWSFDRQELKKGKEIPAAFDWLLQRVAQKLSRKKEDFAELLVTEYPAGSVINWHRDAPPFDLIAGISLQSDCQFKLRPQDKAKQNRRSLISLNVKRRSLYIMQCEARTDWQHSIAPVAGTRYSITLRTLKDH